MQGHTEIIHYCLTSTCGKYACIHIHMTANIKYYLLTYIHNVRAGRYWNLLSQYVMVKYYGITTYHYIFNFSQSAVVIILVDIVFDKQSWLTGWFIGESLLCFEPPIIFLVIFSVLH